MERNYPVKKIEQLEIGTARLCYACCFSWLAAREFLLDGRSQMLFSSASPLALFEDV
jgi:hypothetical protein